MHHEKGMIFLDSAKFFRFNANLDLCFIVRFAYQDYCASFSSFYSVNTVSLEIIKFHLGIRHRLLQSHYINN
jgi:ABC-type uncharacterized transport system permease subunit